ncbi:VOC family protein [Nocardia sp. NPDC049149]|uniref:VOC family protein n=1 Tax=Nocardia sp. NPDC049149 TaxID=3364315 RepID=UPI00371283A7
MTGIATLATTAIMCDEPVRLARFYAAALDWTVLTAQPEFAWISAEQHSGTGLVFCRSRDYQVPNWPDDELPFHIDLYVDSIDDAEQRLIELGATKPAFQPNDYGSLVILLDPSGQPFCISPTPSRAE